MAGVGARDVAGERVEGGCLMGARAGTITARVDPELLARHIVYVKTGLPGMAYLRLDPNTAWPDFLANVVK